LRGRVVLAQTREPVGGATVLAWPSARLVAPIGPGADGLLRATTASDGSFLVPGLPPDTLVSTVAIVDEGLVSVTRQAIDPMSTAVELGVEPVFGAWVHVRSTDGRAPLTSEKLVGWGPTFTTPRLHGARARYVAGTRPELRLLGVPDELVTRPSRYDVFVAHSVPRLLEELPPTSLAISVAGYASANGQFVERRIDLGIPEYTVEVDPLASGFGELTLSLDPWPEDVAAIRSHAVATVVLDPMDGARPASVGVSAEDWPSITLPGIPHGTYHATLRAAHGLYTSVAVPVTVGAVPAAVHLASRETASLHVRVLDPRGRPHEGWVILRVRAASGAEGSMSFKGPPFVIPFLPVGEYTVTVTSPPFEDDGESGVTLDAFERREVVVSGTFTSL